MEIKHISDYIKWIEEDSKGYYPTYTALFRGESNSSFKLLPSVFRETIIGNEPYETYTWLFSERDLIQTFIAEAVSYIRDISTEKHLTWLEYAQHFNVPTRLLDWTTNPLIALYFSLNNFDVDGRVYLLRSQHYTEIVNRAHSDLGENELLKDKIEDMIWHNKPGFPYPIVFHPYLIDQRMRAQSSVFMVWGDKKEPLNKLIAELESNGLGSYLHISQTGNNEYVYEDFQQTTLNEIIIPKENKRSLMLELNRMGINASTVFPGLDGIGKTIEYQHNIINHDALYRL